MFDGKGVKVDNDKRTEEAFDAFTSTMTAAVRTATAGPRWEPTPDPLWLRALNLIATTVVILLLILSAAGFIGILAYAAHAGWEYAG